MTPATVRVVGHHSGTTTGAAIVHREIATRLGAHLGSSAQVEDVVGTNRLATRLIGVAGAGRAGVAVTTSTPLPLLPPAHHVLPIVYDVRWRWTRGLVARTYRMADLKRTCRRASHVFTISHTVADQLRALRCTADGGVTVLELGPGQLQGSRPAPVRQDRDGVLLVGAGRHKRNEEAATLLAALGGRDLRVTAVSVSEETETILRSAVPPDRLDIRGAISRSELADVFGTCRTYLALGVSEGFGFPYLEATYQGCDVITVRQALAFEVLGDDGVLLDTDHPSPSDLDRALNSWEPARVERLQTRAHRRDWDVAARQVADVVQRFIS